MTENLEDGNDIKEEVDKIPDPLGEPDKRTSKDFDHVFSKLINYNIKIFTEKKQHLSSQSFGFNHIFLLF